MLHTVLQAEPTDAPAHGYFLPAPTVRMWVEHTLTEAQRGWARCALASTARPRPALVAFLEGAGR